MISQESPVPDKTQSLENHARLVPAFHGFVFLAFFVNFGLSAYRLVRAPGLDTGVALLVAAALIVFAYYARTFTLTVQDRVIRLEMRLRLKELLPAELQARIQDFTRGQLVAMRFASDAELPELAAKVLRDGIQDKKAIKTLIQNWQADHLRA
jgi:hypothetical protein